MRLLHQRHDHAVDHPGRQHAKPDRRPDPPGPRQQPVPLRLAPVGHPCRAIGQRLTRGDEQIMSRQTKQANNEVKNVSRRRFLRNTGALVVTFSLAGALPPLASAQAQADTPPPVPISLDGWIKIQGDGTVRVFTGRVELGQGNQTALSQIVADELDVPFNSIDLVMGDTAVTPDQGPTWGSTTIRDAGSQLRQAAAEARLTLVNLAAKALNASADSLSVANGIVSGAGKSVSYADLIGDKNFNVQLKGVVTPFGLGPLIGEAKPKDPSQYKLVGTSVPRVDIAPKMTGQFTFMHDVKLPGMLHGRVVRPTGIHSNLLGLNGFDPPVLGAQVVQSGNFVGVVAEN